MGLRCLLEDPPPPPSYLSNIDAQVLLVIGAVANHQAQLVTVAGFVQLYLLPQGEWGEQRKKAQEGSEQGPMLQEQQGRQPRPGPNPSSTSHELFPAPGLEGLSYHHQMVLMSSGLPY